MKPVRSHEAGMTLLELLVVMVVLSLLATLGSLQLFGYLGKAKSETARLQIKELQTAVDLFKIDTGLTPAAADGFNALFTPPANNKGWSGPYLKTKSILADPWGRPYRYARIAGPPGYEIVTHGADGEPGGEGENRDVSSSDDL